MFQIRRENEPIKLGFSFYPKDDQRTRRGVIISWAWNGSQYAYFIRQMRFIGYTQPWYKFWVFELVKKEKL